MKSRVFTRYVERILENQQFLQTSHKLINELRSKLASQEEFVANFVSDVNYSLDHIPFISYILDRFNNFGLDPGQCLPIYNPDPKLRRRNHTIEHFYAQDPTGESKEIADAVELRDNIGNLLPLYFVHLEAWGMGHPWKRLSY